MKKRILAPIMVLGLLTNGFSLQAAVRNACDHINIHSFDTTTSVNNTYHIHYASDGSEKFCRVEHREYFTTYKCLDCGTIVDIIDHVVENHYY